MNSIVDYLVSPQGTILDAMACLDRNAHGIALVTDEEMRLIGTITDGDIRRALLKGSSLDSSIDCCLMQKFTTVSSKLGRAEVLDLMCARSIEQVPIVDQEGRLIGLHVMREIIGAATRPNCAVIMAGGRGERLRPLTDTIPKPMICVAGRPILERIILHLVGYGIREIYISTNYLSGIIREYFGDGSLFGCVIRYLEEDKPLHTGGALSLLPHKPQHPLLVLNGDLITQVDVAAMLEFHKQGSYKITVGTDLYSHTVPFGCLEVEDCQVRTIEEKPVICRYINAGIYVVSPDILDRVPKNQSFPITKLIEHSLDLSEPVGAFEIKGDWIDVGRYDQLRQAQGHPKEFRQVAEDSML